ncbi:MSHA biogenesis protein MshI [Vibrio sp. 10N.286.49.B3]|uniref:MSHA biogenesis protein MshI n=1 Tax=Vibrio sp. 10N.286.49.B3 TaxID=1880855 RepID=UPI000C82B426|nr:MSHA biogenesis protein MshI [Vibrio sp. 10N.286.49.B3]PMH39896.1 MSHA biogenesis protein MshI [Vibrio sp. 10N.286.49.B3]
MKLKSFLNKFSPVSKNEPPLFAVVQSDAIYLSGDNDKSITIEHQGWEVALEKALQTAKTDNRNVSIILHSALYQTYQIDKPSIPEDEWPIALPFLLKGVITERVTDIVADAISLPSSQKIQAYVIAKKTILQLVSLVEKSGMTLNQVIPDDKVWGYTAGELNNFMLLQRAKQGRFKISGFVEHTPCFQRSIRNVTSPLTGVASSELQLDGLALEMQRSVDYLSAQAKGTAFHQLKICCDEEDTQALVEALNQRLNIKASPLVDQDLVVQKQGAMNSAQVLLQAANAKPHWKVNLYPAHLKPKKDHFSLTNVVLACLVMTLLMGGIYGFYHYQLTQVDTQLKQAQRANNQWNSQKKSLSEQLVKHKPKATTVAAVERLKREVQAKKEALHAVGEYDDSQQIGYSGVMASLAQLGRNDISLSDIYINSNTLDLKGLARNASSVPNWVNQFKDEVTLVGRTFEKIKMGRNEQDIITFELHTRTEGK